MYRATLTFSYSLLCLGTTLTFCYPIPLSQLASGYFLHSSALCTLPAAALWVFSAFSGFLYPLNHCAVGIFRLFSTLYPSFPRSRGIFRLFQHFIPFLCPVAGYFPPFPAFCTLLAAAPLVFPALFSSPYPHNAGISCMLFSYNTQDSIGKRFPQPFL